MTIKDYLSDKKLTAVEVVDSLIINLVTEGDLVMGLKVDTSAIPSGTKLTRTNQFKIQNDILTVGDTSLNLATTDMLVREVALS